MDTIETVKIVSTRHDRGYVIINKSDFDPAVQELYGVEKKDDDQPKRQYNRKS
jgi:hypothetical protein